MVAPVRGQADYFDQQTVNYDAAIDAASRSNSSGFDIDLVAAARAYKGNGKWTETLIFDKDSYCVPLSVPYTVDELNRLYCAIKMYHRDHGPDPSVARLLAQEIGLDAIYKEIEVNRHQGFGISDKELSDVMGRVRIAIQHLGLYPAPSRVKVNADMMEILGARAKASISSAPTKEGSTPPPPKHPMGVPSRRG